jgi:rhodanese-related sulfurtransferase
MIKAADLRKHVLGVMAVLGCLMWLNNTPTVKQGYNIREVDVSAARELMDSGALIIDVRGKEQFDFRHIPGAILITLEELHQALPAILRAEAKERVIVVYCGEGLAHGPEGTDLLNKAGFANAVNLKSGIEGWVAAGHAVSKS